MLIHRSITEWALKNPLFPNHMSFIVGPRQSGKSTLIDQYLKEKNCPLKYRFNWDNKKTRKLYRENPYFFEVYQQLGAKIPISFDEIHKMLKWKNYLKGVFDTYKEQFQIIVTGSGRLDLFQRGGDSLAGRYDPYFIFPLTPGEIEKRAPQEELTLEKLLEIKPIAENTLQEWEMLGGFPEPFLSSSERKSKMWWDQYQIRVTEEDVRDLTKLESIDLMRNLLLLLPARIGAPLSLNALREDLDCSFGTIKRYVRTLNQVFFTFEVPPFHKKIHRAIKKERKIYFFNHAAIPIHPDSGARFENMVALLLYRWCSSARERALGDYELFYLRDQDRREVDFLITHDQKPYLLIEAKVADTQFASPSLFYSKLLSIPILQIVRSPIACKIKRQQGVVASIHSLAAVCG